MRQRIRTIFKAGFVLFILFIGFFTWDLPNVSWLLINNPKNTAFMELHEEKLKELNKETPITQIWIDYNNISDNLKKAVLTAEDDTFFDHGGFNWQAIKQAFAKIQKTKKIRHGGSTITQQLAKNLYLDPNKNLVRKIKEALITLSMEHTLSKQRILELYLNLIEWGPGLFGAEAAAQYYYKKSAKNLTLSEAARLAAIIPNPIKLTSAKYKNYITRRTNIIAARAKNQALAKNTDTIKGVIDSLLPHKKEEKADLDTEDLNIEDSDLIPEF